MGLPHVLKMDGVGRAFPQDVGESAAAIWREMLLPRNWLPRSGAHGLSALAGVDLTVAAGQCVGVLGAHRSGKSTLAAIAAGVLAPTAGRVMRPRRCVLAARPTAGFKPGLSVRENLALLGVLHGVAGEPLARLLDDVLARCGVGAAQAGAAAGNLSPHLLRPLALSLLLELPADLLVVDGLSSAGAGHVREVLHGQLCDRLSRGASLVLSADALFLQEVAACVHLLEQGRLTAPLGAGEASGLAPAWSPTEEGSLGDEPAADDDEDGGEENGSVPVAQAGVDDGLASPAAAPGAGQCWPAGKPWQLLRVLVDGEEWSHAHASLIRHPGERLRVVLELRSSCRQWYAGGRFELHGGSSGLPVGRRDERSPEALVWAGERVRLCFDLCLPEAAEDFCGLSFTPLHRGKHHLAGHRLKVLVYGVGRRHARRGLPGLDIHQLTFEPERNALHAIRPDAPATASTQVPAQGQPAASEMG